MINHLLQIHEQVNPGKNKSGLPWWPEEQAKISLWYDWFSKIECLPELVGCLESFNQWHKENNHGEWPPSPNLYHSSVKTLYNQLKEKM